MSAQSLDASGVVIPAELQGSLVAIDKVAPNNWNPNRMDSFMREKLRRGIQKDGFIVPLLVRPVPATRTDLIQAGVLWEIVDGEHRWSTGTDLGMTQVPYVNLGPISDADAQQITIKANVLRGEFDSVKLAEMISSMAAEVGMGELEAALPYTAERLNAMVDLLSVDTSAMMSLGGSSGGDEGADKPAKKAGADEFKSFTPDSMTFDHSCPRCGFQFNDKGE